MMKTSEGKSQAEANPDVRLQWNLSCPERTEAVTDTTSPSPATLLNVLTQEVLALGEGQAPEDND